MSSDRHHAEARLSDYLDGELDRPDEETVEAHLRECADCRAVLEDLAEVRTRARRLEDRPPGRDLWPGIREALDGTTVIELADHLDPGEPRPDSGGRVRRGVFLSLPQLGAAAAALVVLAAGGTWGGAVTPGPAGSGGPGSRPAVAVDAEGDREAARFTGAGDVDPRFAEHAAEVARLQEVLRRGRERLDPNTVRILEKNLALIDGAIRESVEALAVEPGNPFVERHLQRSFQRKVTYLREATALLELTD